jgi:hypothetical protein
MGALVAANQLGGAAATESSLWDQSTHADPLPIIWPLLGRHIAFHRRLVDLTDSVKAALLLSQSIYWTRRGRDIAQTGGWFHKTTEQWARETALSLREQTGARDVLKGLAFVEECRIGVPARMHFRLDLERLGDQLTRRFDADPRAADWSDAEMVAEMLGPAVAYHRTLAGVSGGVHAGLLLSRALYLTRIRAARERDGWICNSTARWSQDIGLTRREQENARRDLARIGIWEEALRGMPSRLVARIRLDCLLPLLTGDVPAAAQDACCTAAPVCGKAAGRFAQKGETSMWQPHILVSTKPPSQIRQKRQSIYVLSTSELVQTPQSAREASPQSGGDLANDIAAGRGGGEDLIFPSEMLSQERAAARQLLRDSGDQAQALLDELAGRLQSNAVRSSPVAYLRGLIARAKAGTFLPELGPRITSERHQIQKSAEQRHAREAEQRRQEIERVTPEYQARVRVQREKLSQLRDDMRQRLATGRPP